MRILSPERLSLSEFIRPGDAVMCGQGTAEPLTLTEALVSQADEVGPLSLFVGVGFAGTFNGEAPAGIGFSSYGAMGTTASLSHAGRLQIDTTPYGAMTRAYADRARRADVVLIQLSQAGDGSFNLGMAWDYTIEAARHARVVVAETMSDLPVSCGGALPGGIRVTAVVRSGRLPVAAPVSELSDEARRIGHHVAEIVPDRAVLQIGVGTLPQAILASLKDHRGLGLHSGVATDAVVDLVECGALDNAHKPFDRGASVAGSLFGSERLRRFADRNGSLRLCSPLYTHAFERISAISNMIAINSVLEVDLSGRVNTEVINGVYRGGIGGQPEFARGAMNAPGGKSIVTLSATATRGQVSRIVPHVEKVSAGAAMADVFVTEWGAADVRHCRGRERARRIAAIAAPRFREELGRICESAEFE